MSSSSGGKMSIIPVYVMMGLLGAVAAFVFVVIGYAHCKRSRKRRKCCRRGQEDEEEGEEEKSKYHVSVSRPVTGFVRPNPPTLEDHLDLVASPEGSILDVASGAASAGAARRPLTAASVFGRLVVEDGDGKIGPTGVTLEFLPEDNTLILVEGTDNKVTRITRTSIRLSEKLRQTAHFSLRRGVLDSSPVLVHSASLKKEKAFKALKLSIEKRDREVGRLTRHPRFIRYLGTCFDIKKMEAFVITDFVAGCTMQELKSSPELSSLFSLSELERLRCCSDLCEAVFFLHGRSRPVPHGAVGLASVFVDGETHRARLAAREAGDRMEEVARARVSLPYPDKGVDNLDKFQERAPEELVVLLDTEQKEFPSATVEADVWSLGATIAQFLLEQDVWGFRSVGTGSASAICKALRTDEMSPQILPAVHSSNPGLHFLHSCLARLPVERPSAAFVAKRMEECIRQAQEETSASVGGSFVFPGRGLVSTRLGSGGGGGGSGNRVGPTPRSPSPSPLPSALSPSTLGPLARQEVEWKVREEAGRRRRAVLFGTRQYRRDKGGKFSALSVTPANDVKDMAALLEEGGYSLGHVYEDLESSQHMLEIVRTYVAAVNKEPEDIDVLLLYFSGRGVQGLPRRLSEKRRAGVFLDRVGISHDLAIAAGADGRDMLPVAALQDSIAALTHRVRRKVVILDCRIDTTSGGGSEGGKSGDGDDNLLQVPSAKRQKKKSGGGGGNASSSPSLEWEAPTIAEEAIDKLTTMFTIYSKVDEGVGAAAQDSHPRRTNGFLTGCLINALRSSSSGLQQPNVEDLPGLLADEMVHEAATATAFQGISCAADFVLPDEDGGDTDLWMEPLLLAPTAGNKKK